MSKTKINVFLAVILLTTLQACASNSSPPPEANNLIGNNQSVTIAPTLFPPLTKDTILNGQHPYSYITSTGVELRYLLYIPEDYQPGDQWPLIVYLHGAGGVGENIELLTTEGSLLDILQEEPSFKFIVLSPQLPTGRWGKYIDPVDELVTHITELLLIDANHLYLTGISLGGLGAWQYALAYPDRFAALAPVGGAASFSSTAVPENICDLKNLPVWIFHGEEDTLLKPEQNEAVVSALEACGGNVKFTLYPGVNHLDTFPLTYEDPALYAWFLEQSE